MDTQFKTVCVDASGLPRTAKRLREWSLDFWVNLFCSGGTCGLSSRAVLRIDWII